MSAIKGKVREQSEEIVKKIGMAEVEVIAINPTEEEFKSQLNMELKEGSNAATYLGESKDGNTYLRVDFWVKVKDGTQKFKVTYFLEDKKRVNKDETKNQYINNIGICSWGEDDSNLPAWFTKREFRAAKAGEEDFYSFLRSWLGGLDYADPDTELQLNWKDLMKGNVNDIKELIGCKWATPFLALATITIKENEDGSISEFPGVYNKGFLPAYCMRYFKEVDFEDPAILAKIAAKTSKDLKIHERFVNNVKGEYGCKDIYTLTPLREYNPDEFLVSGDAPAGGDGTYSEENYQSDDSEY
jgi:hypothetical protein